MDVWLFYCVHMFLILIFFSVITKRLSVGYLYGTLAYFILIHERSYHPVKFLTLILTLPLLCTHVPDIDDFSILS